MRQLFVLFVIACSGSSDPPPVNRAELLQSVALLQEAKSVFATHAREQDSADPRDEAVAALRATADWAAGQEGVAKAHVLDDAYLDITFESGLQHLLWLRYLDEKGQSLYRGGGSGKGVAWGQAGVCEAEHVAENGNVLLFAPVTSEFGLQGELEETQRRLENAGLTVTLATDEAATPDVYANFPSFGLVFIDSHGAAQGTLSGKKLTLSADGGSDPLEDPAELERQGIEQLGERDYGRLLRGELFLGEKVDVQLSVDSWFDASASNLELGTHQVWVSSRFVRNMAPLTDTIVFNGSCYSGWTAPTDDVPDPIGLAYETLNPASYYGWSRDDGTSKVVDNNQCKKAQGTFIDRLVSSECTGVVHLDANDDLYVSLDFDPAQTTTLGHTGDRDRYYEGLCSPDPLVDPRGGTYRTTCVRGARWMAENLNYAGAGVCFEDVAQNCETMGRLYSVAEATGLPTDDTTPVQGLCPKGWHVPSREELLALVDAATEEGRGDPLAALGARKAWPSFADAFDTLGTSFAPVGDGNVVVRYTSDPSQEGQRWGEPPAESPRNALHLWSSTFGGPGALNERAYWMLLALAEGKGLNQTSVFVTTNSEIIQSEYEYYNQFSLRCIQDR